jgi:hypothetical protein
MVSAVLYKGYPVFNQPVTAPYTYTNGNFSITFNSSLGSTTNFTQAYVFYSTDAPIPLNASFTLSNSTITFTGTRLDDHNYMFTSKTATTSNFTMTATQNGTTIFSIPLMNL